MLALVAVQAQVVVVPNLAILFLLVAEMGHPPLTFLLALVEVLAAAAELPALIQPEALETHQTQHQVKVIMAVQEVVGVLVEVALLLLVAMEMLH
jgi:hypothetical protein